jgi:hypothetical protein
MLIVAPVPDAVNWMPKEGEFISILGSIGSIPNIFVGPPNVTVDLLNGHGCEIIDPASPPNPIGCADIVAAPDPKASISTWIPAIVAVGEILKENSVISRPSVEPAAMTVA